MLSGCRGDYDDDDIDIQDEIYRSLGHLRIDYIFADIIALDRDMFTDYPGQVEMYMVTADQQILFEHLL